MWLNLIRFGLLEKLNLSEMIIVYNYSTWASLILLNYKYSTQKSQGNVNELCFVFFCNYGIYAAVFKIRSRILIQLYLVK